MTNCHPDAAKNSIRVFWQNYCCKLYESINVKLKRRHKEINS